jgi:hypothetical protein
MFKDHRLVFLEEENEEDIQGNLKALLSIKLTL